MSTKPKVEYSWASGMNSTLSDLLGKTGELTELLLKQINSSLSKTVQQLERSQAYEPSLDDPEDRKQIQKIIRRDAMKLQIAEKLYQDIKNKTKK